MSREREPFLKPDFIDQSAAFRPTTSVDPWFASTVLLGRVGVTSARSCWMAGEYHAVLRCTEQAAHVHHVPDLLCQRPCCSRSMMQELESRGIDASRDTARHRSVEVLAECKHPAV